MYSYIWLYKTSSSLVNVCPPARVAYKSSILVEGRGSHDGRWKLPYQPA